MFLVLTEQHICGILSRSDERKVCVMNVQGYQKLSLLDYPGKMACIVFTGGCNLRCPFCHNAGLVLNATEFSSAEDEVLSYLEKRKGMLEGVCITGGEPLLQPDLKSFMVKVKDMGYSIKLDTNGGMPETLSMVLSNGLVDYVAMDIKCSRRNYSLAAGLEVNVSAFEKSVEIIRSSAVEHEFRTTVVKGIHSPADFEDIAEWLKGEEKYFLQGFKDSGNLIGSGCSAFSEEEMLQMLSIVQKTIPSAMLRG